MPTVPQDFERLVAFITTCLREGRTADALALAERAVLDLPRHPAAWHQLALALSAAGRYADAENAVRSGLTYDAANGPLWSTFADLARLDRRPDLARYCNARATALPRPRPRVRLRQHSKIPLQWRAAVVVVAALGGASLPRLPADDIVRYAAAAPGLTVMGDVRAIPAAPRQTAADAAVEAPSAAADGTTDLPRRVGRATPQVMALTAAPVPTRAASRRAVPTASPTGIPSVIDLALGESPYQAGVPSVRGTLRR